MADADKAVSTEKRFIQGIERIAEATTALKSYFFTINTNIGNISEAVERYVDERIESDKVLLGILRDIEKGIPQQI